MNAHETEIRRLLEEQVAAWNRGDAEGFASTAREDLSFTNIRGQHWVGRQPFVHAHVRIFGSIYAGTQLSSTVERVWFPGTGVAIAEMQLQLTGATAMPRGVTADADGVLRTHLLSVFELREAEWVLSVYHNVPVLA